VKTVTSAMSENTHTLVLTEKTTTCQTEVKPWNQILGVFSSTFLTILMAEMGDKTQLATMLMSAQSQSPWIVFAGAGAALVSTSLVGVLLGRWLSKHITPKTLNLLGGILLVSISAMLFWDVMN
jgi:putative Ca2+/H+ antiporter (TMEM165/GDT1 family)